MSLEIKHINDYKIIIPETQQSYGIDFKILVQTHFNIPENEDLILCLIEMVTLRNITAIGEKFLYSTLDEQESEAFFKKYEELIDEVIKNFEGKLSKYGIVGFKKWYSNYSFIITKTNQVTYNEKNKPDWTQSHNHSRKEGKSSDYGNIIDSDLKKEEIIEYLYHYTQKLESEFGFSDYPAYCIIVRPISVIKGKTIIPLGNLFLHFATKKEYSEKFYLELINKFLIVWFKNKGVDIISEVYDKAKEEISKKSQKLYLPIFHGKASKKTKNNIKGSNKSLEYFFDKYFENQSNHFLEKCKSIADYLIPKFLNNQSFSENDYLKILDKDSSFYGLKGVESLVNDELNRFEDILLKREIFKIGYVICEIEAGIMLDFITTGVFPNSGNQSKGKLYQNLWIQYFIPWERETDSYNRQKKTSRDELVKNIKRCCSSTEKELISYYESKKSK